MKVTVKENDKFKPITIELVIESEEELCDLYLRLGVSSKTINSEHNGKLTKYPATNEDSNLFDLIESLLIEYKLKK